jgi:3D (Asp-Asp-Asp) domain-containing protein
VLFRSGVAGAPMYYRFRAYFQTLGRFGRRDPKPTKVIADLAMSVVPDMDSLYDPFADAPLALPMTVENLQQDLSTANLMTNLYLYAGNRATLLMDPMGELEIAPPDHEKGKNLGIFKITVYNIAREWEYPIDTVAKRPQLDRAYSTKFLDDVKVQGTGVDNQHRYIQYRTKGKNRGYIYVPGPIGASGRIVQDGVSIAVDPSVIKLGTWVYIENKTVVGPEGWRRADDTGGDIKGQHIDVFDNTSHAAAKSLGEVNACVWQEKGTK